MTNPNKQPGVRGRWKSSAARGGPPLDRNETRITATLMGDTPRFVSDDGDFAIWGAERESGTSGDTITLKGALGRCAGGEVLSCEGSWQEHPQHGWSFAVSNYQSSLPRTVDGVQKWLQSRVQGIGPAFAKAITDKFGVDAFEVIDRRPEVLYDVRTARGSAIKRQQVEKVIETWGDVRAMRQIESWLFSAGVSANLSARLFRQYGADVINVLESDPYRIAEIPRIGFRIADKIALGLGWDRNDPRRVRAGIVFALTEAENDGHAFVTLAQMFSRVGDELGVGDKHLIAAEAGNLVKSAALVVEHDGDAGQRVYRARTWRLECRVARRVRDMLSAPSQKLLTNLVRPTLPDGTTEQQARADGIFVPTDRQWEALEVAASSRVSLLTGGPGCGKCVHPDTRVLVNGSLRTARQLWDAEARSPISDGEGLWASPARPLSVVSLLPNGRLGTGAVSRLYRQEVAEPMRRVHLSDGAEIAITFAHQLFTPDGWTNELRAGMKVAVPAGGLWAEALSGSRVRNPTQGFWFRTIVAVETFDYRGYVYDFEVPGPHNYVADAVIAHNTAAQDMVIKAAMREGRSVALTAPTGKAARRLTEITGERATTVHRLLEWSPVEGGFMRDESNPIDADLVVCDEASMLSLDLASALLRAIGPSTHLMFVGDQDQLPPVGVGKFLADMIRSEVVPRTHLNEVFRQAASSMIITNAHRINRGEMPHLSHAEAEAELGRKMDKDAFWISRKTPEETAELVVNFAAERVPKTFGLDPVTDVMVLAPIYRGACGLQVLNEKMQTQMNPHGRPIGKHDIRVGDRVVQNRNDYTHGRETSNGQVGVVAAYDPDELDAHIALDDGRTIVIPVADMDTWSLAWALSIHKSQGSQWPAVVTAVSSAHYVMLSRALTYTAVTRAQRYVVIVGEPHAMRMAVNKVDMSKRNSHLVARILDANESGELV